MKSSGLFAAPALAALALAVLAACSGGSQGSAGKPSPAATNPLDFPLFSGASVLSTHAWKQTITAKPGNGDSALLTQGAGTYDGRDVVAGTLAVMPALQTWLGDLTAHPPAGYQPVVAGNNVEALRSHTRELGVDFAVFQGTDANKTHGLVVLAVDPQLLDSKAGPMLGMVSKFRAMPKMFRDSLDAQAKKEIGYSLTELTNPDTPIGAAISSLDELRTFGGRGIVLVDASKE